MQVHGIPSLYTIRKLTVATYHKSHEAADDEERGLWMSRALSLFTDGQQLISQRGDLRREESRGEWLPALKRVDLELEEWTPTMSHPTLLAASLSGNSDGHDDLFPHVPQALSQKTSDPRCADRRSKNAGHRVTNDEQWPIVLPPTSRGRGGGPRGRARASGPVRSSRDPVAGGGGRRQGPPHLEARVPERVKKRGQQDIQSDWW